jgi:hypothetical protein
MNYTEHLPPVNVLEPLNLTVDAGPDSTTRILAYLGALLTSIVAGIHLIHPSHGIPRLLIIVSADPTLLVFDPRPLAFVVSGFGLLVGLAASRSAQNRDPYYVAGILLAIVSIVGYVAWHFTGHGGFLPGRDPLLDGLSPLENVIAHLTGDLWAAIAKGTELAMIAVLGVLYFRD